MKKPFVLVCFIICISFMSCIPNKELVYLQNQETAMDTTQVITEKQKPYRVQINDILNIRVKSMDQKNVQIFNPVGEENLNADGDQRAYFDGFTVDLHGNIRIPVLGEINVLGYTTEELEQMLEKKLLEKEFKETANIFVSVKLTGIRFTVNGEVGSTGTQTLYQARVNIFEALANAGDIEITGNRKDVLIIRQYPQGQQIHHVNLLDAAVMQSPYYYIQPNDIIYVKPLKQKSWGTGTTGMQTLATIITALSLVTTTLLLIDKI
ncbi:polysaccharide biosynthesis/export family protein [Xanthomarina sp. F1114]|uniref:polysaccharide biosynthesis/export family protein n=1 Tax=Xanthomarina sp. F1114 TaxID=2996019 RepID=UPI00225E318C|nr:polysaccharide biosynthesis/export family protein [Xanthomarina sp. F1114]MCX7549046.1 polysaccharide biosynthesis/export family protein [Xanthomarina sp. F1114]